MYLEQSQAQKQIISGKMIQSVNILQMGVQDIAAYLTEMSMENPILEIEEPDFTDVQKERLKKLEWLDSLDEQNRVYYRSDREDSHDAEINNLAVQEQETLSDHLLSQLIGSSYSERDMRVFEFIALSLDSRGYYTGSAEDIAGYCDVPVEKAEQALSVMRDLDPAGVCANSLSGCLLKQLEKNAIVDDIVRTIILYHLETLAANHFGAIAKALSVSVSEVKRAREQILLLNPTPSVGFSDRRLLRYIRPDVTVVKLSGYFDIFVNEHDYPVMHMNHTYLNMLKEEHTPDDVREYLHEKLRQYEQVQSFLKKRNDTLARLTHFLVERQEAFFSTGGALSPLLMKDAAIALDVHESTISRAVKDKYLQCWRGIYPLGFFFSKSLPATGSEKKSVALAKETISMLIEKEDKKKPLSDEDLKRLLAERQIELSRRTIAKYREALHIPDSRMRRA